MLEEGAGKNRKHLGDGSPGSLYARGCASIRLSGGFGVRRGIPLYPRDSTHHVPGAGLVHAPVLRLCHGGRVQPPL